MSIVTRAFASSVPNIGPCTSPTSWSPSLNRLVTLLDR